MSDTTMPVDTTDQNEAHQSKKGAVNHVEPLPLLWKFTHASRHSMRSASLCASRWYANRRALWLLQHVYQACWSPSRQMVSFVRLIRANHGFALICCLFKGSSPPMVCCTQFPIVRSCSRRWMFLSASLKAGRATCLS